MPPNGGSVSWRLGGGGRGVLEELTGLIILPCVSEYLERGREGEREEEREGGKGGREGGREREKEGGRERGREGGREGREGGRGGREEGSRYIYTHTVYNSDYIYKLYIQSWNNNRQVYKPVITLIINNQRYYQYHNHQPLLATP